MTLAKDLRSLIQAVADSVAAPARFARSEWTRTGRPETLAGTSGPLGWLPGLSLLMAGGLWLVATAFTLSRAGARTSESEPLFWVGLMLLMGPVMLRLASAQAGRTERLGLAVLTGLSLYLVKVMHSPYYFMYSDEFLHAFNTQQIMATGRLFSENTILSVSPLYPGLPSLTAALSTLTGLSIFPAGLIVIGAARLVLMFALFLFMEQVSGSPRVAGLAAVLYAANANFVYWSSQFGYESLSLPLAVFILVLVRRRQSAAAGERLGLTLAAGLAISAVVATHHLTSYFVALFLTVWALFHHGLPAWAGRQLERAAGRWPWLARRLPVLKLEQPLPGQREPQGWRVSPAPLAVFALAGAGLWLVLVAGQTVNYLSPVFGRAITSIVGMIAGEETGRELFKSSSGYVAPLWERVTGLSSVFLALVGLPFGLGVIWRRYRRSALALLLGLAAGGYFAMLGLRFSPAAWETGNRASAYLFLGLAFTLALAVTTAWDQRRGQAVWRAAVAAGMVILFCGGIIAGWTPQLRLARPYLVEAAGHPVEPQGAAVSRWLLAAAGPGNGVATDQSNSRYMMTLGQQRSYAGGNPDIVDILELPTLDAWMVNLLQDLQTPYVLVDRRRVSWDNMAGYYFDQTRGQPLNGEALFETDRFQKFDQAPRVSRVLDSGNIVLYDLRALFDDTLSR